MSEWRDIATAPKDGTEFLAYDATAGKMDVCTMVDFGGKRGWSCEAVQSDGEYGPDNDEFGGNWWHKITHWMPLPEAPK